MALTTNSKFKFSYQNMATPALNQQSLAGGLAEVFTMQGMALEGALLSTSCFRAHIPELFPSEPTSLLY